MCHANTQDCSGQLLSDLPDTSNLYRLTEAVEPLLTAVLQCLTLKGGWAALRTLAMGLA